MSDNADIVRRALAFARRAAAENPRMGWRVDGLDDALAALDALVAERDEARRQRDFYQGAMIAAENERAPAEARVARLEEALGYYASQRNWTAQYVYRDRGQRARAALASGSEGEEA